MGRTMEILSSHHETHMKIAVAQINCIVGDLTGNAKKIIAFANSAKDKGAALVVTPELALSGYPPEDLLFRDDFHAEVQAALKTIAEASQHIHVIVGYPNKTDLGIYNSAAVFFNGKMIAQYDKQYLPNYGVFDEKRYFIAGNKPCIIEINKIKVGLLICEDLWFDTPIKQAKTAGAEFIIGINASPFDLANPAQRFEVLRTRQKLVHLPILYTNLVGGQDELIFDGGSFVFQQRRLMLLSGGNGDFPGGFQQRGFSISKPTGQTHWGCGCSFPL